jgi:hypothetical protein
MDAADEARDPAVMHFAGSEWHEVSSNFRSAGLVGVPSQQWVMHVVWRQVHLLMARPPGSTQELTVPEGCMHVWVSGWEQKLQGLAGRVGPIQSTSPPCQY